MSNKLQLTDEVKFYEKNKASYFKLYKNKFIVIKGVELTGPFSDQYAAYAAGVENTVTNHFLLNSLVMYPKRQNKLLHSGLAASPQINKGTCNHVFV